MWRNRRIICCHLLIMALTPGLARAGDIYVDDSQPGPTWNGQGWSTAFRYLQDALGAASANDTIHVAQGTYYPDVGSGHTNNSRSESFSMETDVTLFGGYIGYNDPSPNTRNPALYVTLLSGDLTGNDGPGFSNRTDNSYHVVRATSVSATAILDGVTIKGGYGDSTSISSADRTGAGLYILGTNSSQSFVVCTITENEVLRPGGTGGFGGGIGSTSTNNSPTFTSCVIRNNRAAGGGGGGHLNSSLLASFTNCTFTENFTTASTDTGGGALHIGFINPDPRRILLEGCTFAGNYTNAAPGGAIYHEGSGNLLEARGCVFQANIANGGVGGAVNLASGSSKLIDSRFLANECHISVGANGGGAVAIVGTGSTSVHTILNCEFLENVSNLAPPAEVTSRGGALFAIKNVGSLSVTNSLFARNRSYEGAAISANSPMNGMVFTNVSVTDNHTYSGGNVGGIIMLVEDGDTATVSNCILYGNSDANGNFATDAQIEKTGIGTLTVSYSCIKGGFTGDVDGGGNVDVDPKFASTTDPVTSQRSYRLSACSPCIDASDYDAVPADSEDVDDSGTTSEKTPDLDLRERVVDIDVVTDTGVALDEVHTYTDMGAYEHVVPTCAEPGDLNNDTVVDGLDIQPFVDCVLATSTLSACACGDLNVDTTADYHDVACFVQLVLFDTACAPNCAAYVLGYADCDTNGIADINQISEGTSQDCNTNAVPDECDVDPSDPDGNEEVSNDVNTNGIPDECEDDCNGNDVPDDWDIAQSTSDDVNTDGVPDECQPDCNTNGIPDDWDIAQATSTDCNSDGEPDECSQDCNTNGVPDDCDIDPEDPDGDEWVSPDCNSNGFPDECDLAIPPGIGGSLDCNTNGIPDECDIASCESDPACDDCNENGIPDSCDIAAEISEDANTNGIPDEYEGEGFMGGGGGESMMMGGEGSKESEGDESEGWDAYYEWSEQQCWGPACETNGAEQFAALAAKLKELGLPVTGRPMGP